MPTEDGSVVIEHQHDGGDHLEFTGVLVGVPTYNEIQNAPRLVAELRANLPGAVILVIDDGSPDGTGAAVERLAEGDALTRVMHRPGKMGLGTAYLAAFTAAQQAGAHIVMTMDADFSHRPVDAPDILRAARRDGVDMAVGSRYIPGGRIEGWPATRTALSWVANRLIRLALATDLSDCTGSFRAYRVALVQRMQLDQVRNTGYSVLPELLLLAGHAGARVAEVPITFVEREHGATKLTRRELVNSLVNVLRMWRRRRRLHSSGPATA